MIDRIKEGSSNVYSYHKHKLMIIRIGLSPDATTIALVDIRNEIMISNILAAFLSVKMQIWERLNV